MKKEQEKTTDERLLKKWSLMFQYHAIFEGYQTALAFASSKTAFQYHAIFEGYQTDYTSRSY
ncbi:MAG: hypothetical protein PUG44_09050 [Streptococcus hyointestinalis]|nr:hypothetical protein [Streptococcus hyointestinalis]MDD7357179.1 hypothetical protein [Streptococcus hyointestinalis]